MRRARLGSVGPEISVIGYGAWEAGGGVWGDNPSDDDVVAAMRAGFDAGIDWIDTAETYGDGRSEALVSDAVQGTDVLVFTKVAPRPSGSGFDPESVRAAAQRSLKRLRRDAIDLYQLHWRDPSIPIEETWGAMAGLVDDGLVRWIGLSNFDRDLITRCEAIRHVDSLQPHFSLLNRDGRDDLFPFCDGNGTGIIAYAPLGYGLLTGAITADTEFGDHDWRSGGHGIRAYDRLFAPGKLERSLALVEELAPIAVRLGVTQAQLALAWVVHQRGVSGAIAGSRSAGHVRDNAGAGDVVLDAAVLDEIEAVLS